MSHDLLGLVLEITQFTPEGEGTVCGRCVGIFPGPSYALVFLLENEDHDVQIVATDYQDRLRILRGEGRKVPPA